jgi:hypothetical protein
MCSSGGRRDARGFKASHANAVKFAGVRVGAVGHHKCIDEVIATTALFRGLNRRI